MNLLFTVEMFDEVFSGGAGAVARQLAFRLADRGHDVTVATSDVGFAAETRVRNVRVLPFALRGNSVRGLCGDTSAFVRELNGPYDVIFNYAAQTWGTDLTMAHLDQTTTPAVLAPCGYSALRNPQYTDYFRKLPKRLDGYAACVFHSGNYQDYEFSRVHGLENSRVIPNGVDKEEFEIERSPDAFRARYGSRKPYMLLCVANFHPAKGQQRLLNIHKRLKRKDVALVLVGNPAVPGWKWTQRQYAKLAVQARLTGGARIVSGLSRDEVISAFFAADLFVLASEVECSPLVILESLGAGRPFVSMRAGCVEDYRDLGRVVESEEEFAAATTELLDNRGLREELGAKGREFVLAERNWHRIAGEYERLFEEVAACGGTRLTWIVHE